MSQHLYRTLRQAIDFFLLIEDKDSVFLDDLKILFMDKVVQALTQQWSITQDNEMMVAIELFL